MLFQLQEIILWPRNKSLKPRRLHFKLGSVNVITGASRTGKSAIIPIIDYCLGSGKCRIPVKTIRDTCEWFGIVVQTSAGQKLLARREPGTLKATGDMFILEGDIVNVPNEISEKNVNVEDVKRSLDELSGLTSLNFDIEESGSGFKYRPSFRDLSAFIFQPQNIVANSEVFFYKTETYEHREKLRTIFPYVLNAISNDLLAKQHELNRLQRELRRKEHELSSIRQVSERWLAEIQSRVSQAKELGLISDSVYDKFSREEMVILLKSVVNSSTDNIRVSESTVSSAIKELADLQREESQVSMELSVLRKRLSEMTALRDSTIQYKGALQIQRDRLQISEWMLRTCNAEQKCPLCNNQFTSSIDNINKFYSALKEIEETAGHFDSIPAAFDREFERVKADINTLTEKLRGIQIRRQALQRRSEEARQRQYDTLKVSRFIGNLEESLITFEALGKDSALNEEVHELRQIINNLEKEISGANIKEKTKRAIKMVNAYSEKLLPLLDNERPNDPISLLIDDLTIKVGGINREDYLWEIGSGSNWLSYHIALTLGLQQYFLSLHNSPVPGLIAYDQPSQVYFPKRLAIREDDTDIDPKYKDEDIEAVRKIFSTMASVVRDCDGNLQVIVLDHASDDVWGTIDGVHCVEEWRGENKLVPLTWLE